jgi:hypothetical protein
VNPGVSERSYGVRPEEVKLASSLVDAWSVAGMLRRQHVRLGVLVAILIAVCADAGLQGTGSSARFSGDEPKPVPAGQVALVSRWLSRGILPSGVRQDVTQTFCPTDVLLCVTAPDTPRSLISALRAELAARGTSFGKSQCASPAGLPDLATCFVSGSYHGVPITLGAGQRNEYAWPSSWGEVLVPGAPSTPRITEPLPPPGSVSSLGAIPHQWHLAIRCTIHTGDGCTRYIASFTVRGSACGQIALLSRTLVRSNFSISQDFHYQFPSGERCGIAASKKLKPGGGGWFIVGASLADQPDHRAEGGFFISAM